jgi:Tfp pilus assembly protein PilF
MRKTFSLLVALIIVGCTTTKGSAPNKAAMAESRYKMGIAYLSSDTDHLAYQELKGALELEPKNEKYLYTMGLFYMKKEMYKEAETYLKNVVGTSPDNSDYLNAYATLLANTDRTEQAVTYWDKVIADPGYAYHIVALYNAANALYESGQYARVPAYLEKAISINRRYSSAYNLLFESYIRIGDNLNAERVMLQAAGMIPDELDNLMRAGEFYYEKRDYAKAIPFLERVLASDPLSTQGKRAGELMKKLGLLHE